VSSARRMLDVGSGVGGPAAWVAERCGLRPVCAEPMPAAAHAARRLFDLRSVVAWGDALPFADASFEVVWCLGVLCTTPDRAPLLAEISRVLAPAGRVGLLVFQAEGPLSPPLPEGNDFPSEQAGSQALAAADLTVVESVGAHALPRAHSPGSREQTVSRSTWRNDMRTRAGCSPSSSPPGSAA
jgi:SAM-dependent methyltransferase